MGGTAGDEEEYPDDFEEPTKDAGELEEVIDNYKRVLSGDITLPGEMSLKKPDPGSFSPISEAPSADEIDPGTLSELRSAQEKKLVMDYLGEDIYQEVYEYLIEARSNEADDKVIAAQMRYFVGDDKTALSY